MVDKTHAGKRFELTAADNGGWVVTQADFDRVGFVQPVMAFTTTNDMLRGFGEMLQSSLVYGDLDKGER